MFDSTFREIDFEWIELKIKKKKGVYVWIHPYKSELKNKLKCKINFKIRNYNFFFGLP